MQLKVTPRLEERINARWLIWHPLVLIQVRNAPLGNLVDVDIALEVARTVHHFRYIECMSRRISERAIHRCGIDDPRLTQDVFHIKIENALRRNVSKVKGVRRTHKQIKEQLETNADSTPY
jgi:hypothetical protein